MSNFNKKINGFIETYYWIFFAGLAVYTAVLCFLRLDVGYVASWDEARHGISAYEMLQNKNLIVNTFNYEPDYWNLKPPMSFYGIMLGFALFGYSVLGLRFYSALSYFLICIVTGLFVKKRHGRLSSLFAMAFLCCNTMMLTNHGARAGDADALYQLFFTIAMLAMMEIPEKHSRSYVCGFCFAMAFLTKSYHAGIILVIGGLYMIIMGMMTKFKVKEWLLFGLSMAVPAVIWFFARFTQDGMTFFLTMLTEDVLSRSSAASEGHSGPFTYYLQEYFFDPSMIYGLLLIVVVIGLVSLIFYEKKSFKPYVGYLLWLFIPLLAFSSVSTKLNWYNYPIFVPLCILAAVFLGSLFQKEKGKDIFSGILLTGIAAVILFYGYQTFDKAVLSVHEDQFQTFLAESVDRKDEISGANAFIQVRQEMEDGSVWNANHLFVAEIEGDYRCRPYGVSGYLDCTEKKVLYISREDYENMKKMITGKILYETEDYLMIGDCL